MLVDSHCHLDRLELDRLKKTLCASLDYAREQGVVHFLCVCIDLACFPHIVSIAQQFPEVSVSVGLHPTQVVIREPTFEELLELAKSKKVVAIGETGLDYYRDSSQKVTQQERFRQHIRVARAVNKPLIVHTRWARADTLAILKEEGAAQVGGVLHCFTEDLAMAESAMEENFYISFSGIITFKNSVELKKVAQSLPLDRVLIETDSPYLTPTPFRGKPNQPSYVRYVAQCLAELRGCSFNEIAQKTTKNFFNLFKNANRDRVADLLSK